VKNFLEDYAETHGLPSPGRNVNRITQSLTLLPAETSYKSVYRDFIAGLENNGTLKLLKYDALQNVHVPHSDQQVIKSIISVHVKCIYLMKQYANKLISCLQHCVNKIIIV
jgi:hypothetical protein